MSEFLQMGGYAGYVWSSFGLGIAVLIWNLWAPTRRRAELLKELSSDE